MTRSAKILIVDDDSQLLLSCARILNKNDRYKVTTVESSVEASKRIESNEYDLIISDLAMPEVNGLDLLEKARVIAPETPFVIFSAYGNVERVVEAMRRGAFDFIEKPFRAERFRVVIEKSLHHRKRHVENRALEQEIRDRYSFNNLIGKSQPMQKVFEMISRVATGESNVTILGESGTGKEVVARAIHTNSSRSKKPFVPVNCGAFPENLFESELFGHEKGAFTGAFRRKPGLLEFADGGTFFLDEICELSPVLQVKLLRMLQDKKVRRVGGAELVDVDVRIISASNKRLDDALENGSLRADLYYRLNVIAVYLPPLRERKEDIPLLCRHFIEKYSKSTPKTISGVSDAALKCLEGYSWPGNVRQLENVIERAVTLTADEWLQRSDLPDAILCGPKDPHEVQLDVPLKQAKDKMVTEFEIEYLTRMLSRHNGNITRAAQNSDIDRRTFHRMLNRHRIRPQNWRGN